MRRTEKLFTGFSLVLFFTFLTLQYLLIHDNGREFDFATDHDHSQSVNLEQIFDTHKQEYSIPKLGEITPTNSMCTHWNCLDSYKCVENEFGKISVYIYPFHTYVDADTLQPLFPAPSEQFIELIVGIVNSDSYTTDPENACLFIPSIDLLNRDNYNGAQAARILNSLPYWNNGSNHLLFTMVPGIAPEYITTLDFPHGKGIVAGAGLSQRTYRRTFDISIPTFSPMASNIDVKGDSHERTILLLSSQLTVYSDINIILAPLTHDDLDIVFLRPCSIDPQNALTRCDLLDRQYNYPNVLTDSKFCLITAGKRLATPEMHDILHAGCVPVISMSSYVMPFSEVIDWKRAVLFVEKHDLSDIKSILLNVLNDHNAFTQMQQQCRFIYNKYFHSMERIGLTAIDIITDNILPYRAKSYSDWNRPIVPDMPPNPFFIPLRPSQDSGFTAIVLTYNRVALMKQVVLNIAAARGVAKIIIVWNNQQLAPPQLHWSNISVPIVLIRTKSNRLSNRFYPYDEIQTDCVLSIDDDITMVTTSELEFAYKVWTEYPDRLIGFPPRSHSFSDSVIYDSEWMSNISMVLTGVSFYHKYYHFLYTSNLPGNIKTWIDKNMNCEDIAMNFLISNITGKAPIKILPRKKFRATSINLSNSIQSHLVARGTCMQYFYQAFGVMPLHPVEFRADPVLYKTPGILNDMLRYPSDGSL